LSGPFSLPEGERINHCYYFEDDFSKKPITHFFHGQSGLAFII
jgi:hypothetical protein